MHAGVFFKFAKDDNGIYASDAKAMKVAGAEVLGLHAYAQCGIAGLHCPLMTLIDYRGYRLIASCKLPLSSQTLVYGSADGMANFILHSSLCSQRVGGRSVYASDRKFAGWMEQAAAQLNLKKHRAGHGAVELSAPCDIEGHLGRDGR